MKQLGIESPVLIVSGNYALGQLESNRARTLSNAGYEHHIFLFGGECTRNEIDGVAEKATALGCKCIIGAGGGKVIDTARGAADQIKVDVVCCPTVASSDAPCSALSFVCNAKG